MDRYLVSYEYKEKNGRYISTNTTTEVLTKYDLEILIENNDFYNGYLKILFFKKL